MTSAEVIASDAAERKEKARKKAEGITDAKKDNSVWPEFLEHAFWRGMLAHYHTAVNYLICPSHHHMLLITIVFSKSISDYTM
jgi:hypothetical protein